MAENRQQIIDDLLKDIDGAVDTMLYSLLERLSKQVGISDKITPGLQVVGWGWITSYLYAAARGVNPVITAQRDRVSSTFEQIDTYWAEQVVPLLETITTSIDDITDSIEETQNNIIDVVIEKFSTTLEYVSDVIGGVFDSLGNVFGGVVNAVDNLANSISNSVSGAINAAVDSVNQAFVYVSGVIQDAIIGFSGGIQVLIDMVTQTIEGALDDIGDFIDKQAEQFSALAESLPVLVNNLISGIADLADEQITDVFSARIPALMEYISDNWRQRAEQVHPELDELLIGAFAAAGLDSDTLDISSLFGGASVGIKSLFLSVAIPIVLIRFGLGMTEAATLPAMELTRQRIASQLPYQLLPVGDAANALRRGFISPDEFTNYIARAGYGQRETGLFLDLANVEPDYQSLSSFYYRGLISEDEFLNRLYQIGFRPEDAERLLNISRIIPPVQDLITMAVREVFSPGIRSSFGLDEDFPEQFATRAAQHGLSREDAQNYWAMHWALPSVNHGFEMFHRGVINREQLDQLLKALDVMPFWREALVQIAYSPFTRVDVRRMHKLGILSDDDTRKAYMDIGYDAEKAQALLEFTKVYNETGLSLTEDEATALSRSQILRFYGNSSIDRELAFLLLESTGYSPEESNLILDNADLERDLDIREEQIDVIIEQARTGTITWESAQDKMGRLGLAANEMNHISNRILIEREKKTKLPSKADLDDFYALQYITQEEYLQGLGALGYAEKWAKMYLAKINQELENAS